MNDENDETDSLILSLFSQDDPRAATVMFDAHYQPVYRNVSRIIRNGDDAKDLVLELFHAVWEKRHSLNIRKPVRKYLLTAAHNRAINYLRHKARTTLAMQEMRDLSIQNTTSPPADVAIEAQELDQVINTAIGLLPEKIRITFLLSRNLGMTYKEMADYLQVSEKAIEKNMTKALKLLRMFLRPHIRILLILEVVPVLVYL